MILNERRRTCCVLHDETGLKAPAEEDVGMEVKAQGEAGEIDHGKILGQTEVN